MAGAFILQPRDTMSLIKANLGSVCGRVRSSFGIARPPQQSRPRFHAYPPLAKNYHFRGSGGSEGGEGDGHAQAEAVQLCLSCTGVAIQILYLPFCSESSFLKVFRRENGIVEASACPYTSYSAFVFYVF